MVHAVAKSYKKRRVVESVSLDVHRGEAGGLLGPPRARKATVFLMVTGLLRPPASPPAPSFFFSRGRWLPAPSRFW